MNDKMDFEPVNIEVTCESCYAVLRSSYNQTFKCPRCQSEITTPDNVLKFKQNNKEKHDK